MDLAARIANALVASSALKSSASLYVALLRELARGKPVSLRTLALVSSRSPTEVSAVLRAAPDTEYDARGDIVGYGITLQPTSHSFEVEGRQLYTWCALDTLMFPAILGATAHVRSRCPESGEPVSLVATPNELRDVEPAKVVVSLVEPGDDIRQSFCCNVHFLASLDMGRRWARRHPGVKLVSVGAAFQLGQEIARKRLGHGGV
jgi:alkylmercury lyase